MLLCLSLSQPEPGENMGTELDPRLSIVREALLKIRRFEKEIAEQRAIIEETLEVTGTRRPTRRKAISVEDAAALIRNGGLHDLHT